MPSQQVTNLLSRGEWWVVCALALLALIFVWRQYTSERKRSDMTREALDRTANALTNLCTEIKASTDLASETNQKLLETLVEALRK